MGAWGAGLYQDDTTCDVKESIKDKKLYQNREKVLESLKEKIYNNKSKC